MANADAEPFEGTSLDEIIEKLRVDQEGVQDSKASSNLAELSEAILAGNS